MPELPEVENIAAHLRSRILDFRILGADNLASGPKTNIDTPSIINQKIINISRRAKYLILHLENHKIIVHLGMTGQLLLHEKQVDHGHNRAIFCLTNDHGTRLFLHFVDQRKFGRLHCFDSIQYELFFTQKKLGLEPLDDNFSSQELRLILYKTKTTIKSFLMNQKHIAGIGNIYASEILFDCEISPLTKTQDIGVKQVERLKDSIVKILQKGIEHGGSTIKNYKLTDGSTGNFQQLHKVYGKIGQLCNICQTKILKIKQEQRSTYFCPQCQK